MSQITKALIVGPSRHKRDITHAAKFTSINISYVFIDEDEDCLEEGQVDFHKCLAKIEEVIRKNEIEAVICTNDNTSILCAALCDKYPDKFPGPSLASVFLAFHKYYTRLFADPNPVPFHHIDISQPLPKDEQENALDKVGLPAIMKPCTGTGSALIKKITCLEDMTEFLDKVQPHYNSKIKKCGKFLADLLPSGDRFPLVKQEAFVLEQFVDTPMIVSVDGYVCNKEIVHWTIGDNINWSSHPNCCQMVVMPSKLSPDIKEKIWELYDKVASRLVEFGFDNGFLNQEMLVRVDGDVKLMEINARPTTMNYKCYSQVLPNGNFFESCLQISQGVRPTAPQMSDTYLSYIPLACMISGEAEDIIDFEASKSIPHCDLWVKKGDYIESSGDAGVYLGTLNLVGSTYEEVLQLHERTYSRLFKRHPMGHNK